MDARDDAFIGGCGTQIHYGHRFANLYYWVRSSRAGQGAASSATLLLARFGLTSLGLQRIEIVVATGNHASKQVAEKVGAVRGLAAEPPSNAWGDLRCLYVLAGARRPIEAPHDRSPL